MKLTRRGKNVLLFIKMTAVVILIWQLANIPALWWTTNPISVR